MSQTIATDLEVGMTLTCRRARHTRFTFWHYIAEFWDLGHTLFRTTPETYPVKFLAGDVFDDAHLLPTTSRPFGPPLPVGSVDSLTELQGCVSVIYASSFFHLFSEEKQFEACKRLAALLDPRPGSIIFGSHGATPVKGQRPEVFTKTFCHSPESWTQMWEEQIFEKGQVKVSTAFKELETSVEGKAVLIGGGTNFYWLSWSVERL